MGHRGDEVKLTDEECRDLESAKKILLDEEGYADFQIDWAKHVMIDMATRLLEDAGGPHTRKEK